LNNDIDSLINDLTQKAKDEIHDKKNIYKTILTLLKKNLEPTESKKINDVIKLIINNESDKNIKTIFETIINFENNITKIKPRRVLETIHSISKEELDIQIPLNLYIFMGKQYLINNEIEKALELFKFIHNHNHNTFILDYIKIIYFKLSEKYIHEGNYDQAAEILNEFSQLEPNDLDINHQVAILNTLYTKLNRLESINASWERLIKLWFILYQQNNDISFKQKILAKHKYFVAKFVELEKWDLAKEELSKILDLEPDNMIAKRAFVQL